MISTETKFQIVAETAAITSSPGFASFAARATGIYLMVDPQGAMGLSMLGIGIFGLITALFISAQDEP